MACAKGGDYGRNFFERVAGLLDYCAPQDKITCPACHYGEILDNGMTIFNPGSISLPKNTIVRTFGIFDGEKLNVLELETGKEFPALR